MTAPRPGPRELPDPSPAPPSPREALLADLMPWLGADGARLTEHGASGSVVTLATVGTPPPLPPAPRIDGPETWLASAHGTRSLGGGMDGEEGHLLVAVLARAAGCVRLLSFARAPSAPPFRAAERARLAAGLGPVRLALGAAERLTAAQAEARTLSAALDAVPIAVLALDGDGRPLVVNRAAGALRAAGDGIELRQGRIASVRRAGTEPFATLVARAARQGEPALLRIDRRPVGDPYLMRLLPVAAAGPEGGAVALVARTEVGVGPVVTALAPLLGLTPVEGRLGAQLADDVPLADAAARLGLSLDTVRTYLKQMFAKLGVRRQPALVRLFVAAAAKLGTVEPPQEGAAPAGPASRPGPPPLAQPPRAASQAR